MSIDGAELLAGQTNCGSINDWHQLFDVITKDAIEEFFGTIL